jgi:putative hydrolase of the HAD superfamily
MTIKCIVFDLDNTLWECDPLIIKAEKKFYLWLKATYPEITNSFTEEALIADRMSYIQARPELHYDLTSLRKNWMRHIAAKIVGMSTDEDEFERAYVETGFQIFWQERNNVIFYDGVIDMLENLSQKYSLGVITNGNADVNFIGIGHYFDFSISSELAGVAKPHEDIFHQAMQLTEHTIETTVYVGDNPKCDVLGPQEIGMRALWYNPTLRPWPGGKTPAAVFRYHHELEDKIKKL